MKPIVLAAVFAAALASANAATVPAFTLLPSIASGLPGAVTGWGYDITNTDPDNFLVLNDSTVSGSLSTGTFGTYVDYIALNFIVIGPGAGTGPVNFSPGTAGVGEFDIVQFVPIMAIPGAIDLDYSLFSQDPNSPNFDPGSLVASGTVSANTAVQVVPEPGTVFLLAAASLALGFALRWRGEGRPLTYRKSG